jgi:sarcosine oxidase subunit beta
MSNPAQAPGFDESVDEAWEITHLEAAIERLPLLEQGGRVAHWAGLYEVTPDAHPIIGRVPHVENYVVAAGFSGHGFMHGPAAGLLVAEILLDGAAHTLDLSVLSYERFTEGHLLDEYNVV